MKFSKNVFGFLDIVLFEFVAVNSCDYDENTYHRLSIGPKFSDLTRGNVF